MKPEYVTPRRVVQAIAAAVALVWAVESSAANRFYIDDATLPISSTGHEIIVKADLDEDLYGFSVSLEFEGNKVRIMNVQAGADVAPLTPEYNDGIVTNSNSGRLVWGVVLSTSAPTINDHVTAGNGRELLRLTVDVLSASATTTTLNLVDRTTERPIRANVMTAMSGDSIPNVALGDALLTINDPRPTIDDLLQNSGRPGDQFFIVGQNYTRPGLAVTVCGKPAAFTLLPDNETLSVTAPDCSVGPAAVQVCNDSGCVNRAAGFTYEPEQPKQPILTDFILNSGEPGHNFFVVGQNFGEPGLSVSVCGQVLPANQFSLQPDGETIIVTAPQCAEGGCVRVEVCNDFGCDFDDEGFCYPQTLERFKRGDANMSGAVDVSDAQYILNFLFLGGPGLPCPDSGDANDSGSADISDAQYVLNFLFLGGAPIPAPGNSVCGPDDRPDTLGPCEDPSNICN